MTKIIADSSCDIIQMEGADFAAAPMLICTDRKTYTDDKDLNITEMLDHLASLKEKTGTSCPSPDSWLRAFGEADTIFIASGKYENCFILYLTLLYRYVKKYL